MNIDFEPKQIIVTVGGVEYPVNPRCDEVDGQLKERESKIDKQSEYENSYSLVEILLGKEAAKAIFPGGKKENLDRMYRISRGALKAYNSDRDETRDEEKKETFDQLDEIMGHGAPVIEFYDKASQFKMTGRKN